MKYDFIAVAGYDYADRKMPHTIEAPESYRPFAISRPHIAGGEIEFWFIREHVPKKRKGKS